MWEILFYFIYFLFKVLWAKLFKASWCEKWFFVMVWVITQFGICCCWAYVQICLLVLKSVWSELATWQRGPNSSVAGKYIPEHRWVVQVLLLAACRRFGDLWQTPTLTKSMPRKACLWAQCNVFDWMVMDLQTQTSVPENVGISFKIVNYKYPFPVLISITSSMGNP